MIYFKTTFHLEVNTKVNAQTFQMPLALLHSSVQTAIKEHAREDPNNGWLQEEYTTCRGNYYFFLYTESGNRIDIWL